MRGNLTTRLRESISTLGDDVVAADLIEALEKEVKGAFAEGFVEGKGDGWVNDPNIKDAWKSSKARSNLREHKKAQR